MEGLVNTQHHSLTEVEEETTGHTLCDVEAEALADTVAERFAEVKSGNISETLTDLNAISPDLTPAPRCQRWRPRQLAKH